MASNFRWWYSHTWTHHTYADIKGAVPLPLQSSFFSLLPPPFPLLLFSSSNANTHTPHLLLVVLLVAPSPFAPRVLVSRPPSRDPLALSMLLPRDATVFVAPGASCYARVRCSSLSPSIEPPIQAFFSPGFSACRYAPRIRFLRRLAGLELP